jgi:hypothetical protein
MGCLTPLRRADVPARRLLRRVRIPILYRFKNRGVLDPRLRGPLGDQHLAFSEQGHRIIDSTQTFFEIAIMGSAVHRFVKKLVVLHERPVIFPQPRFALHQFLECHDFRIRCLAGTKARSGALQHLAHHVQLEHRLACDRSHHESRARLENEHAFALQPAQRVAHRRAAYVEPRGNLQFGYALSRLELPLLNGITQLLIDPFAARGMIVFWRSCSSSARSGLPEDRCTRAHWRFFCISRASAQDRSSVLCALRKQRMCQPCGSGRACGRG